MSRSPSLSDQTVDAIQQMILTERRFRPGDKLPNELELAEELGVSRITLREAIRVLCTRGFLEIQRGRGTFVLSSNPALLSRRTPSALDFTRAGIRDLLELLLCLEPEAAYHAAGRGTEEELREIASLLRQLEEKASRGEVFAQEARALHSAIVRAGGNPMVQQILSQAENTVFPEDGRFPQRTPGEYREMVRYIQSRNGEGARAVARMAILRLYQSAGVEIE